MLNCSGFVIEGNGVVATILTSASLLIGDEDSMPSYVTVSPIISSSYFICAEFVFGCNYNKVLRDVLTR